MKRRLKIIIKPEDLIPVFIGGRWCRSSSPYLPDTQVVETHWNEERVGLVMTLEHPHFPEVEEGKEPLIWFHVEEQMSEEPEFGFFLKRITEYVADYEKTKGE